MRLEFIYLPTQDLSGALALYRDALGFDELWREGELTVGLQVPGSETALTVDAAAEPGPARVRSSASNASTRGLPTGATRSTCSRAPSDIPGGRLMGFRDADGNHVYVMDQSAAE